MDMARGRQIVQGDEVEEFWALKDINFEVKEGNVVGIIGRNGAGKSTLLKVLSRITEPTTGRVTLRGRVASLLEVGTGFHPELTGRENIFLNGAILGMTRAEIKRKFDEIVSFAEVERFLDTPVKRYSSGLYVRLAFAVAAHLDPEILVVDEVLAVGDVDFQRKCIGTMKSVASSGRTVLLVSHTLALVEQICSSSILLNRGKVVAEGNTKYVLEQYLRSGSEDPKSANGFSRNELNRSSPHFTDVSLCNDDGESVAIVGMGEPLNIKLETQTLKAVLFPWIGIQIRTENGELIAHVANREAGFDLSALNGKQAVHCRISTPNLQEGAYQLDLILADASNQTYHKVVDACRFQVRAVDVFGTGMPMNRQYGCCFFKSKWELTDLESSRVEFRDSNQFKN